MSTQQQTWKSNFRADFVQIFLYTIPPIDDFVFVARKFESLTVGLVAHLKAHDVRDHDREKSRDSATLSLGTAL